MMSFGLRGATRRAFETAIAYVHSRQCPDGGFCFYRSDAVNESNLSDTYHAISTLRLLGQPIPRLDAIASFLHPFCADAQLASLVHVTGIASALQRAFEPDAQITQNIVRMAVRPLPPRDSLETSIWLERAREVAELKARHGLLEERAYLRVQVLSLLHHGGFGPGPNLIDTAAGLGILRACGNPSIPPELRSFVDLLQREGIGFVVSQQARRLNLGVVAAGVECCLALELPIRYAENAIAFVLACQCDRGAFAASPDALPDLKLTHTAVHVLLRLNGHV